MTIDDALTRAFSDYQAAMLPRIKTDGADDVRRRVHRRQRNRLAATTAVAVSAVAVSAGLYLRPLPDGRPFVGATPPETVTSPSSTLASDAPPSPSVAAPSASAEPSGSFAPSDPNLNIAMRGPSEVVLRPAGDRYHGTLTLVAANVGTSVYRDAFARFVIPAYADIDQFGGFGPCLFQDRRDTPTGMRVIECTIDYPPIPAMGGQKTLTVGLVANLAPQSQTIEATGCWMEFVIMGPGTAENNYNPIELKDATPNDNRVTFKLKLLPS
jgi:hypothetical protein